MAIYSQSVELDAPPTPFDLPIANPGVDSRTGQRRSLNDYAEASILVVVFTCNHCPYAKHVEGTLIRLARQYAERGVQFVLISPNDPATYAEDSFEGMEKRAREKDFPFPYLYDETQEVARAYGALCTPDLYAYRNEGGTFSLGYHGRIDETRPGQGTSTGKDLEHALQDLLSRGEVTFEQFPSMGCSIKWRPGSVG
jgi:peroxiredoxin